MRNFQEIIHESFGITKKMNNEPLSEDEKNRLESLENDLLKLMKGGHAGTPPKGAF